jgi:hypothetical protein
MAMPRRAPTWGLRPLLLALLSLASACAAGDVPTGGGRDGGSGSGCSASEFECDNGHCIPRGQVCNGTENCVDGSDEDTCNQPCSASEFECRDGSCIPMSAMCNDVADCPTGDDEASCGGGGGGGGGACMADQFTCTGGACVPMTQRCDGRSNCPNGDDETGCPPPMCSADQFRCSADSSCIPRADVCNGTPQCPGGSDEMGCTGGGTGGGGGGCGSLTFAGECVGGGGGVRWCENNSIHSLTCSSGYSCQYIASSGIYDCATSGGGIGGGGGCGSVTYAGGCDGDWVYWCEANSVRWLDCFPDTCGWTGNVYGCVAYSGGGGSNSCAYAYDGVCDEPTYCTFGTDSYDCTVGGGGSNSCVYAYDGVCDEPTYCAWGTDTYDCIL